LEGGKKPGLLSRGYGRQSRGVVVRGRGEAPKPEQIGDEPAMLVASGLDIPVAACAKRLAGAQALRDHDVSTLVLDDGFAHRAMGRDLDIVVLRGEHPSGNGHLLPWGSLREPLSSLRRAGLLWFHFKEGKVADLPPWVKDKFPSTPVVISRALVGEPKSTAGEVLSLSDARVVAATGIAFPEPFFNAVQGLGANVADKLSFRDHHDFTRQDVQDLRERKSQVGAEWVVVTPKDAIKLKKLWSEEDLAVLGVDVEVVAGEAKLLKLLALN
jgi:tetraacyldisaccharide 4'-kinase